MNSKIIFFAAIILLAIILISWRIFQKKIYPVYDLSVYNGNDLGCSYSYKKSSFRLWSPNAEAVKLRIYDQGMDGKLLKETNFNKNVDGTWLISLTGDWKNKYYTFQVKINNNWNLETTDIYAKAVGVNGQRGMIVDLKETNPINWDKDKRPVLKGFSDIVLYEVHLRDISMDINSGIKNKGKFLGLAETGTINKEGEKTGLDHIADLGITHIHILPSFDFRSIDETKLDKNKYNWGYDPQNYNAPEGSYSTDPNDGMVRIKEFKEMVKSIHNKGIRVVMDVVYNHTGPTETSNFNQLVPGYYYRYTKEGKFSNASACNNETASEQPMMRKFIIESLKYWAREYHIDGFRFDLMAIHDIETMNQIRSELDKIDSTIFLYGEGWTAGDSPLPEDKRALKGSAYKLNRIAVFCDEIRDGLKGHWANVKEKGFLSGKDGFEESIKFGIVGAIKHNQINYEKVNYSKNAYSNEPTQTVLYVSCHDNPCLWDKLKYTLPEDNDTELLKLQKLANAVVLTSQGVPFLFSGEEFVRTKFGVENSYESPDSINQINWSNKSKYKEINDYYKALIRLRKNHPAFHMGSKELINKHLKFFDLNLPLLIGYQINNYANGDKWKTVLVYFNANKDNVSIDLPEGEYKVVATGQEIDESGLKSSEHNGIQCNKTIIPGRSMMILVDKGSL
jgi:pullulanase